MITSGAEGTLYLFEGGALRLAASTVATEPPASWVSLLLRAAETIDEGLRAAVRTLAGLRRSRPWPPGILATTS